MKKLFYFLMVAAMGFLSSCSEKKINSSDVPQSTRDAFNAKYPGATDIVWEKEKKNDKTVYGADFDLNGKKTEAEFDETGIFIREK